MDDLAQPLLDLIKAHSDWAAAVMFITAFGESFAFVSLLFPGTTVLIAAGTLLSGGTLPYASILVSAILGAVLGDSVSYWLGRRFGGGIARIWPFSQCLADPASILDALPRNRTSKLHRPRFTKAWPKLRRAAGRVFVAGDARACSAGGPALARSEYRYQSAAA